MVQIKLEAANVPAYCALDVGGTFHGWPILSTVPGSAQMIVDIPDAAELGRLDALVDLGQVVDYREAHADYQPLGWPVKGPAPDAVPGDTFPLVMADGCQARGHYGARSALLGIVDTGLDAGHVAFDGKALLGDLQDGHGHGTHVASTAASAWGIASDSAIHMLNVLPNGSGTEAEVANGFRALADGGCDVISASLGGSPSQVIDAAVEYAKGKGSLVVCAAGNNGDADPTPGSPARAATVSVYAVDRSGQPASFTDGKAWATTGSQGVAISAAARGTRSGVMTMSGTSMATPHVSGLLCLLRAAGLSPQACLDYLAQHRVAVAGCTFGVLKLVADFGAGDAPPEEGDVDLDGIVQRAQAIRDSVAYVQSIRPTGSMTKVKILERIEMVWTQELGPFDDQAREIIELAQAPKAEPVPVPVPGVQFVSPLPNGAIHGRTKWLPGSLGCDLFCKRGSVLVAPADCIVEEVLGGYGMTGGDELILALPDKSWAWRYRHSRATVRVGDRVKQGQAVATVDDASLDQLGAIPGWATYQAGRPFPDGWQHCDLSVNRGTDRFAATGGGGGNVSAYEWITGLGYQGIVLARTPGPTDVGYSLDAAIALMTPEGRR